MSQRNKVTGKEPANCRDAILWIGESYAAILCDKPRPESSDYCYRSDRGFKQRCYVHEAELRGCCRKVAEVPDWIEPGKSRVFLVHRGAHKDNDARGSIFGYYVVKRIEFITDDPVYHAITEQSQLPWTASIYRNIVPAILKRIESLGVLTGGHREAIGNEVREQFNRKWKKKDFLHQVSKGEGVTPRLRSPRTWPSDKDVIDDVLDLVEDTLEDCLEDWIKDQAQEWFRDIQDEDDDRECAFVPLPVSQCETHRFCSKRLKIGATYVVDALTAEITNEFLKGLAGKTTPTHDGEELFRKVMKQVGKKHQKGTLTRIYPCLEAYAEIRGEIVLLNQPYPVFERKPKAAFRGLLRIDGDKLLDDICEGYKRRKKECIPTIPYCVRDDNQTGARVSRFASEFGFNKVTAEALLQLYGDVLAKLKPGDSLALPEIGKFAKTKGQQLHFTP